MDRTGAMRPGAVEQLMDAMPDGVVVVGPDGLIRFASRHVEPLSGYSPAELVGAPVDRLVPERLRARHAVHRASFAAHPSVRAMGSRLDIVLRRKDGVELPVDISLGFVDSVPIDTSEPSHSADWHRSARRPATA